MKKILNIVTVFLTYSLFFACSYSFTGSSIPAHISTIHIPIVINNSSEIGLEETVHQAVYGKLNRLNIASLVEQNGKADLTIKILSYSNTPDQYTSDGLSIKTYKVKITANVIFYDNIKSKVIYEKTLRADGIYDHSSQTEEDGAKEALDKLNDIIINDVFTAW